MDLPNMERSGWARMDISREAQGRVAAALEKARAAIEVIDVADHATQFLAWRHLGEYDGEYRNYAGDLHHCLLEKALEHYLSVVLARPAQGMTAIDIGSCRSVVPSILRRVYGVTCYEQDLTYPPGVNGMQIGSSAESIPLESGSVDFMTLHCTFEHFEGSVDTGFVKECARLLRPGGRTIILPLYLNESHCNVTGLTDAQEQATIGWDPQAQHFCEIPEWHNRFGRHYSPSALQGRVLGPAAAAGLVPRLMKVVNWEGVHPSVWLRWILVLEQPGTSGAK